MTAEVVPIELDLSQSQMELTFPEDLLEPSMQVRARFGAAAATTTDSYIRDANSPPPPFLRSP